MSRTSEYRRFQEYLYMVERLRNMSKNCPNVVFWNDYYDRRYLKTYHYGDRYYKRMSRRKIRRLDTSDKLPKGNISNKYFDYWWTIT